MVGTVAVHQLSSLITSVVIDKHSYMNGLTSEL